MSTSTDTSALIFTDVESSKAEICQSIFGCTREALWLELFKVEPCEHVRRLHCTPCMESCSPDPTVVYTCATCGEEMHPLRWVPIRKGRK